MKIDKSIIPEHEYDWPGNIMENDIYINFHW